MNRRFFFTLLVYSVLSACGNNKPAEKKTPVSVIDSVSTKAISLKPGLIDGIELFRGLEMPPVEMAGKSGDTLFYCSSKGKIEVADTIHHVRKLIMDLHTQFLINKVFLTPCPDQKWFVTWEETNMEGMRTYAALYVSGATKPEWKLTFHNPNPGKPVVDGDVAYMSTLGTTAKISLTEGKIIWQNDSLFNHTKLSFQKIDKPLVYPDKVVFIDLPIPGRREYRDTLFLDPVTGKRKK